MGQPEAFDESVEAADCTMRLVARHTHTPIWRSSAKLKKGSLVDVFLDEINRWQTMRVTAVSADRSRVKVS